MPNAPAFATLCFVAAIILVPTVLALGLVAWFGRETRGWDLRRLDDAMDEPLV